MNRIAQSRVFSCRHCDYTTRQFIRLIHHYKDIHEFQRDFSVVCGIESCQKSYRVIKSFQSHILRKHPIFYYEHISHRTAVGPREPGGVLANCMEESDCDVHSDNEGNNEEDGSDEIHVEAESFDFLRQMARFLLSLRETKKIPMSVCSDVINQLENIISVCHAETKSSLEQILTQNGIHLERLPEYEEIFRSFESALLACKSLSTTRKQNTYFEREFNYIEPVELIMGKDIRGNLETVMYVPLKQTLAALLDHTDVLAYVVNSHESQDSNLRDFCDGNAYKANILFKSDTPVLQIQLYTDDFQVSNPLGNKIKKYKITAVYFLLGNFPPKFRSKLSAIQLAMLVKTAVVKKYGLGQVMKSLITDLKSLETDGLTFNCQGGRQLHFRGTVSMMVADNLAAHEVSGMMESFVADRICRFCTGTKTRIQEKFEEKDFQLRTPESYDAAVSTVEADNSMARVYGIKSRSVLNVLDYYHVSWGVPSDLAHDIFEGFGCEFLEFCLKSWVEQRYMSLNQINDLIETFPYSASDKVNRPSRMPSEFSKFRVKQTASQAWCLLRTLPLIVGHLVPDTDELWRLYMQFLDIVEIVCAPAIPRSMVNYLRVLLTGFLEQFFEINADNTVKPKAHFLIHYPSQILWFGPLVHCWTLRFEGKHHYFKETIQRSKNHRNVCKTMARRHQYVQALYYGSTSFLNQDPIESRKGCLFPIRLLLTEIQELLLPLGGPDENVYQTKSVKIDGITYETGCCVILAFEHDCYTFGRIENCFLMAGVVHLLLKVLQTDEFSSHYHAYLVSETHKYCLRSPDTLLSHHPLSIYKNNRKLMTVLKFYVEHE